MDRKGIIAVATAVIVLLVWTQYYSRQTAQLAEQRRQEQAVAEAQQRAAAPPAPEISGTPAAGSPETERPAGTPLAASTPEQLQTVKTPAADYTFTNLGGAITRVALTKHRAENNTLVELNQHGSVAIGAVSEGGPEQARAPYQAGAASAPGEITFERTDARQLQTVKKFILPSAGSTGDEYAATLELTYTNRSAEPLKVEGYRVYAGAATPLHQTDLPTYTGAGWMHDGKFVFKDANSFRAGGFLMFGKTDAPLYQESGFGAAWAGVTNQYYTTLITPQAAKGSGVWAQRFTVSKALIGHSGEPAPEGPIQNGPAETLNATEAALLMPGFDLAPAASLTQRFQLYTGPREFNRLGSLGAGQDAMMDFGTFKIVSKTLLASMNWLRAHLGSYALAIIVLTIIIRGLMWPLQNKATQSMKNIAALQPKMNELKERYPDDPTRVQQETMKLYKQYQINPVMGCLPMLVQIPIFFGFYNMLGKAVELRNSTFLWVKDLSQPDTVAMIAGYPVNVLPLLMAVTMFWQMRLSPKSGDAVQQRVFMFMPLIFIMFCYRYASALALYWTVQNLFSIVQLYITRNRPMPVLQKVATSSAGRKRG